MPSPANCHAIMLTPRGRGAVATIRLQGDSALDIVRQLFQPLTGRPLTRVPSGSIVVGQWRCQENSDGERLVICPRAPDQVDVHCHGGWSAPAAVLQSLAGMGVPQMSWEDWLATHHRDPIARAARVALASACTESTAAVLLDQYAGALRREMQSICDLLEARRMAQAETRLSDLQASGVVGMRLTQPWRVVLCGRPNVGKSSLINAILGYQRAIVHYRSGTTRDVVTATTAWQGWPIEFADTAGFRDTDVRVESAGIDRARRQVESADLVMLVSDASHGWDAEDRRLAECLPADLLVHNKTDIGVSCSLRPSGWSTVATTGEGVDALMSEISRRLVPRSPEPGSAVPFTAAQISAITEALDAVRCSDDAAALTALKSLLSC